MIMQTVSQCLLFWWYHSVDKHQAEFHTKSFLVLLSSTMFDARWSTSYWQTKWSVFFFQNPVCGKDICKKLFNKNQILLSTTCTCQTRKPNLINYSFEDYLCTLSSSNVYNTSLYTCNKLYLSCPSEVDVGKKCRTASVDRRLKCFLQHSNLRGFVSGQGTVAKYPHDLAGTLCVNILPFIVVLQLT